MLTVFHRELWTKELIAWYLYDFANSFVIMNGIVYFSQWVVVDRRLSDFWLALPFILATAILIPLSPYIGARGDRRGNHQSVFVWTTLGAIFSALLMYAAGSLFRDPSRGVLVALIFYGCFQFFLQLALVPYSAFMKHIARPEHYGRVSGLGFTSSQIGNIAGLVITLPIIYGRFRFLGEPRLATMFIAALAFLFFALPSFFFLRSSASVPAPVSDRQRFWRTLWQSLDEARAQPLVVRLLIAFYFFSDAIASLMLFAAIYLQNVFGVGDPVKAAMAIALILGFAVGAFAGGVSSDALGHRRLLVGALGGVAGTIISIAFVHRLFWLYVLFPAVGIFMGVVFTSSRAYLASLISANESGKFFGLYTLAERFASIVGPAVWGITIWAFAGAFPWNYRFAALAMAGLVLIGILPLLRRNVGATVSGT